MAQETKAPKDAKVVQDTYDFLLWMIPKLAKLPRDQRFLLGDRIESVLLGILESLVEASYSRSKAGPLDRANLEVQKLRFLLRLTHDLKYISLDAYRFAAEKIDAIGSQIGGWLRASGGKSA